MKPLVFCALAFVAAVAYAAELEAPSGFTVHDIGPLGGQVLVPDGWAIHDNSKTQGNWIIAKSFAEDGSYDTGLKLQLMPQIKKITGMTPRAVVQANIAHMKRAGEVVNECPTSTAAMFQRQCVEVLTYSNAKKPKQKYHVICSFLWNDDMDLVVATIFGAPVEEWDSVATIYSVIKDIKFIDQDRKPGSPSAGAPTSTRSAPPATTAKVTLPPEITSIARVTAVQFINPTTELPKRLGTDLDAFGQFTHAITTTVATYLRSHPSTKPAVANLMLGIAPPQHLRVWLMGWDDLLGPEERAELLKRLESLTPPRVANGPIAFNLTVALRGMEEPKVDPSKLQLPGEWREALKGKTGPTPLPDGLPNEIWLKR